jgi:DNA repair protein RecN (Recombination protein N)
MGGVIGADVRMVNEKERVVELARMLAGMDSTETGRAHAEELLAVADADKRKRPRRKR